jgi:diguanylate cyclase (GGDEF)-like protein/PAS domain S-box-containing protein
VGGEPGGRGTADRRRIAAGGERRAHARRPAPAATPSSSTVAAAGGSPRILLVEDDVLLAETVRDWLERAGYELAGVAADERGAVDLARGHRPDLAVVDVRLRADGDGVAAARAVERAAGTPTLFLTGYPEGLADADVGLGWMTKPAREPDLLAAVATVLAVAAGVVPLRPPAALRLHARARPPALPPAAVIERRYLRAVLDTAPHGVAVVDRELRIVDANPALARRLGVAPPTLTGTALGDLAYGDDGFLAAVTACFTGPVAVLAEREWVVRGPAGAPLLVAVAGGLVADHDAAPAAVILHLRDVVEATPALAPAAEGLHDHLTGLATAALFADRLELARARAARTGTPFAVLLIELDGVDAIEEGHGAAATAGLLADLAARIDDRRRDVDAAARLATGMFALVLDGPTRDGAVALAHELRASIDCPVRLALGAVTVAARVGLAWSNDGGVAAETMFQRADLALCRTRSPGAGPVRCDAD